jgi:hypothetical protein
LARHDNEQADLTHRVLADKILEEVPMYKQLLKLFTTSELIKWSGLCEIYEKELTSTPVFSGNEQAQKRWNDLKLVASSITVAKFILFEFQKSRRRTQHPRHGQVLHSHQDRQDGRVVGFVSWRNGGVLVADGGQQERSSEDG